MEKGNSEIKINEALHQIRTNQGEFTVSFRTTDYRTVIDRKVTGPRMVFTQKSAPAAVTGRPKNKTNQDHNIMLFDVDGKKKMEVKIALLTHYNGQRIRFRNV